MLTRYNDPVLRASGWRAVSASWSSTDPSEPASWAPAAPGKLHTQSVAIVVITISSIDRIIGVPVDRAVCTLAHGGLRAVDIHMLRDCCQTPSAMLAASLIWFANPPCRRAHNYTNVASMSLYFIVYFSLAANKARWNEYCISKRNVVSTLTYLQAAHKTWGVRVKYIGIPLRTNMSTEALCAKGKVCIKKKKNSLKCKIESKSAHTRDVSLLELSVWVTRE